MTVSGHILQEVAGTGERLDPRLLDVMALRDIYTNLVPPCIGKDDSWVSLRERGREKEGEGGERWERELRGERGGRGRWERERDGREGGGRRESLLMYEESVLTLINDPRLFLAYTDISRSHERSPFL